MWWSLALLLFAQDYSPGPELTGQLSGASIGGSQEELDRISPLVEQETRTREFYLACVMQKAQAAAERITRLDIAVDVGVRLCRVERDAAIEALHAVERTLKPTGAAAMAAVTRTDNMLHQVVVEVSAAIMVAESGGQLAH